MHTKKLSLFYLILKYNWKSYVLSGNTIWQSITAEKKDVKICDFCKFLLLLTLSLNWPHFLSQANGKDRTVFLQILCCHAPPADDNTKFRYEAFSYSSEPHQYQVGQEKKNQTKGTIVFRYHMQLCYDDVYYKIQFMVRKTKYF